MDKENIPGASSSCSTPPLPPWIELPADVTANILHRLGAVEILENAQKVCTTWQRVCKDPAMWRVIDMRDPSDLFRHAYNLDSFGILCRHAVDRSQGQLIDINMEYFGTDELLFYISERCNHLKHLTLINCGISSQGLKEAVQNFPKLEVLNVIFAPSYAKDDEIISTSCPQLKSFTYNAAPGSQSSVALAVAKSMPNLCHLCLLGDNLTNEGLEAILDGCPQLESLDIRRCFGIDLGGDLGKRCSDQIKDVRRPHDPLNDYKWASEVYLWENYFELDFSDRESGYSYEDFYDDYTDSEGYVDYVDYYSL